MTNREILARKSNEELAKWIKRKLSEINHGRTLLEPNYCSFCIANCYGKVCTRISCKIGIEEWFDNKRDDLKEMSNEELAGFISNRITLRKTCETCLIKWNGESHCNGYLCRYAIQQWLEQEAKDDI